MNRKLGNVCIAAGTILIIAALSLFVYNQWDNSRAGAAADEILVQVESAVAEQTEGENTTESDMDVDADEMPETEIDGVCYIGYLSIPKLELTLPVASEWSYPQLRCSPCRYYGAVKTDDLVIAAHNYARHFGKIKTLSVGDTVTFTDMNGTVTVYEVQELNIFAPVAVEEMTSGSYPLTLFTCTYGGKSRVTVQCGYAEY